MRITARLTAEKHPQSWPRRVPVLAGRQPRCRRKCPLSELLGHSRTSFTDSTYVLVFPEIAKAAAEAAAAIVPRKNLAQDS
jgi:hypothetical protein